MPWWRRACQRSHRLIGGRGATAVVPSDLPPATRRWAVGFGLGEFRRCYRDADSVETRSLVRAGCRYRAPGDQDRLAGSLRPGRAACAEGAAAVRRRVARRVGTVAGQGRHTCPDAVPDLAQVRVRRRAERVLPLAGDDRVGVEHPGRVCAGSGDVPDVPVVLPRREVLAGGDRSRSHRLPDLAAPR